MALTVSALADQAGLSADTVRYYERASAPGPARRCAVLAGLSGCGEHRGLR